MKAEQTTKYVDITRSYIPIDPNSFPDGLHVVDMREEDRIPVMAYDGANILPTAYGYKSYFGTGNIHPADALVANIDYIIIFQNNQKQNIAVALTASGIYYKAGSVVGPWAQAVILVDSTASGIHYPWTFCVLENKLYVYRSNNATFYEIASAVLDPGITVVAKTPSFLNMGAQIGIFKAGNRLGFWDSDDSVAWSNLDSYTDFTPDLTTLAGSSKFADVMGRIVTIKTHGDGFLIYATQSITYVQRQQESLFLWEPARILEKTGIAYMEQVVEGLPDTIHFAYTTTGLYRIENATPEIIVPEVTDFLKLYAGPKYLKMVEGRYLFIEIIDPNFTTAFAQYTDVVIPPTVIVINGETFSAYYNRLETEQNNTTVSLQSILQAMKDGAFNPAPPVAPPPGPASP